MLAERYAAEIIGLDSSQAAMFERGPGRETPLNRVEFIPNPGGSATWVEPKRA